MNRLESLDWLRGLLALSIALYHLTLWKLGPAEADTLLGRLGIYGVSMFFVLSGLAMAATYHDFMRGPASAARFYVRRIFRIWPLLWLAVATVTLGAWVVEGRRVEWSVVLLNLTTLFGFISPGAYINTGAWSIGNEMVYYALTPLLLAAYQRGKAAGNSLVALSLLPGLYFAWFALDPARTLASQWLTYINPFNNLGLYAIGLALYFNARDLKLGTPAVLALLAVGCAVLAWYPVGGDLVVTVTGWPRVAFVAASTAIVLGFFRLGAALPRWLAAPLALLGAATYGVYLLHPIVFQAIERSLRLAGAALDPRLSMLLTVVVTIAVSVVLYKHFELPLIRLGKRLTPDRRAAPPAAAGVRPVARAETAGETKR
ncbi:MAG: acyltransferase [Rubrivivax sp.]|nr:acyltransferase [Rubrivivax sp.]